MHTGDISFCDKVAFNIKSDEIKKYILQKLESQYSLKIIHKHFEKYEAHTLPNLVRNPHLVCLRSNGNPYFLYLMKYNFIQYCVFIDKKIQQGYYLPRMIVVQMTFHEDLFADTIFDGEMVKANDGKWYFLLNDMLVYKGEHLNNVNLPKRVNMMYDVLASSYQPGEFDLFRMTVKTFVTYNDIEYLVTKYIHTLPYTCRGLYFKPLFIRFKDILYNFDDNLIKKVERIKYKTVKQFILIDEKPSLIESMSNKSSDDDKQSECDSLSIASSAGDYETNAEKAAIKTKKFYVRKTGTPDIYELFDYETSRVDVYGIACIPTMKLSKKMRELTKDMNMVDKMEMDFEWSTKFNKWIPCVSTS